MRAGESHHLAPTNAPGCRVPASPGSTLFLPAWPWNREDSRPAPAPRDGPTRPMTHDQAPFQEE
jgi:hypothetical protein